MNFTIAILCVLVIILTIDVVILTVSNVKLWIELKAMKASTHQITYLDPLQQHFQKPSDAESDDMTNADFNNIQ